ncbi:chemotaxis protein CheW [Deferribacter thermophilus]|uniref:chemotaxis protein CheW n=1 Tax=Deferribacter thermophilus TaxID=53573 RepID=UPI003C1F339D
MQGNNMVEKNDFDIDLVEEEVIQLVGFKLGDEEYAIDILKVQEIIRMVEITSVPRVDPFVLGVMNLRGKVIPVVDLRLRFNLDKSDFDKNTRIIVVNFEKESIGFVVDEVTEVMRITKSIVEPTPPLVGTIGQEYILGICKYNERLIILLDIDRVIFGDSKEESELKKKFSKTDSADSAVVDENEVSTTASSTISNSNKSEEKQEDIVKEIETNNELTNEVNEDNYDIDALIAAELEKREKETEELIKKKKKGVDTPVEEVLNDALEQSEKIYNESADQVTQEDLDALIAAELEKREKETEELIKKKKSKKKIVENDTNENSVEVDITLEQKEEELSDTLLVIKRDSLEEIKSIADKIINGEVTDLDFDIKGEIGELLKLLLETKGKIDELEPTIDDSSKKIPTVKESLDDVTEKAENAALNLMNNTEKMIEIYKDMENLVSNLENVINMNDENSAMEILGQVEERISNLDSMGFEMLNSLEFQDITEQKIRKIINYVEEIGAKFGAILGYMKVKQIKGEKIEVSQEDVDKLLSDFGLN